MATRKTEINGRYVANRRADLIGWLGQQQDYRFQDRHGPRCEICWRNGRILMQDTLELDHINSDREWSMKKLGPLQRIKLLEQEAAAGKIQLLCKRHNGAKRDSDIEARETDAPIPF